MTSMGWARAAVLGLSCLWLILWPMQLMAEPAIGQFELKDLENEIGEVELQSQNAYALGQPRRRYLQTDPGSFAYDTNSVTRQRHALEIEMTMTRFLRMRVGIEFEKERFEDPASPAQADGFAQLELTEVAVEGVVIVKPIPKDGGFGFGVLSEFEHPLAAGELNSILFGPILGALSGPWSGLLNFMFIKHFGAGERGDDGLERDDKWDVGYAAQIKYAWQPSWALALEAYGTFDRIGNSGRPNEAAQLFGDHDQHRAGPVVYREWRLGSDGNADSGAKRANSRTLVKAAALDADADDQGSGKLGGDDDEGVLVRLGTGVLIGLNDNTPDATLKLSLEVEF